MFYIMCQVSGGVTGFRQALLKKSGKVQEFATKEEAETEAARLRDSVGKNSLASFRYFVVGGE